MLVDILHVSRYLTKVIRSFKSKGLEAFAVTGSARKLPVPNTDRVRRILAALDAAGSPDALNIPGFGFHELGGARKGTYSVCVTGNWRITFRWDGADAISVDLEDYH